MPIWDESTGLNLPNGGFPGAYSGTNYPDPNAPLGGTADPAGFRRRALGLKDPTLYAGLSQPDMIENLYGGSPNPDLYRDAMLLASARGPRNAPSGYGNPWRGVMRNSGGGRLMGRPNVIRQSQPQQQIPVGAPAGDSSAPAQPAQQGGTGESIDSARATALQADSATPGAAPGATQGAPAQPQAGSVPGVQDPSGLFDLARHYQTVQDRQRQLNTVANQQPQSGKLRTALGVIGGILGPPGTQQLIMSHPGWQRQMNTAASAYLAAQNDYQQAVQRQQILGNQQLRNEQILTAKAERDAANENSRLARQQAGAQFDLNASAQGATPYTPPPPIFTLVPSAVPGLAPTILKAPSPDEPANIITNPATGKKFNPPPSKAGTFAVTEEMANALPELGLKPGDKVSDSIGRGLTSLAIKRAKQPNLHFEQYTDEVHGNVTVIGRDPETGEEKTRQVLRGVAQKRPSLAMIGGNLSDDAIELEARKYLQTGAMPALGMGGTQLKQKILERAAAIAKTEGMSPADVISQGATYKAGSAGLTALTRQQQAVLAFEKTTTANLDLASSLSRNVDRTGSPLVNKYLLYLKGQVAGDSDTIKLQNAVRTAANEYAKVISGSMGNTAVTDSLRNEAEAMLNSSFGKGTFDQTVQLMKQEMENRRLGYAQQIEEAKKGLSGSGGHSGGPPSAQGSGPKAAPQAAPAGAGAPAPQAGSPKKGDVVFVGGQWRRITNIHADGTFDGEVVKGK